MSSDVELHMLSQLSPITNAVLESIPADLDEEQPMAGPYFVDTTRGLYENKKYNEWLAHFYGDGKDPVPKKPPYLGPTRFVSHTAQVHCKKGVTALKQAVKRLQKYSHWELVLMVMRDFVVPAAEMDDANAIQVHVNHLLVAVTGNGPDYIGHPQQFEGQEVEPAERAYYTKTKDGDRRNPMLSLWSHAKQTERAEVNKEFGQNQVLLGSGYPK